MAMVDRAYAPASAPDRAAPSRGHLRMVDGQAAPKFSALPHAVLFSDLSDGAIRLYAVLQSHWWGESGECTASHATLAAETGKKERTIRALLSELVGSGVVLERRLGRGQSKAYRAGETTPSGRNQPVESGDIQPVESPKRPKSASQAAKNGQFKRPKSAAPIEEDSGKKTKEEDIPPVEVVAADAVPSPNVAAVATSTKAPRAPSETPSGRLIDIVKAAGVPLTMRPQDHKALKDSGADPAMVAEAYCAIFRGEWGDDFMRRSLSVQFVIGRLAGFESWKARRAGSTHAASTPRPGSSASRMRSVEI